MILPVRQSQVERAGELCRVKPRIFRSPCGYRIGIGRNRLNIVRSRFEFGPGGACQFQYIFRVLAPTGGSACGEMIGAGQLAGTYHLAAGGTASWCEYAKYVLELARAAGAKLKAGPDDIKPISTDAYPVAARRPKNSRLDTTKLAGAFDLRLPDWQYHVQRLVEELVAQGKL